MNRAIALPSLRSTIVHAAAPKIPKAIKLSGVHFKPVATPHGERGFQVTHMFTNGSTKKFLFADPVKAGMHLTRLSRAQWRNPGRDPASGVLHDIGETIG